MPSSQQLVSLQKIAEAAVSCEMVTGFPAEISTVQCILESAWLTRTPGNNCFGIKANGRGTGVQMIKTHEVIHGVSTIENLGFETYDSITDCFTDHARLIIEAPIYAACWLKYLSTKSLTLLINCFAPIYATDPTYADQLRTLLREPRIETAISNARAAIKQAPDPGILTT